MICGKFKKKRRGRKARKITLDKIKREGKENEKEIKKGKNNINTLPFPHTATANITVKSFNSV